MIITINHYPQQVERSYIIIDIQTTHVCAIIVIDHVFTT